MKVKENWMNVCKTYTSQYLETFNNFSNDMRKTAAILLDLFVNDNSYFSIFNQSNQTLYFHNLETKAKCDSNIT